MIEYNIEQYNKNKAKTNLIDIKCPTCNNNFKCTRLLLQRALNSKRLKFCSILCASKARRVKRTINTCLECSKEIVSKPSENKIYCNHKCAATASNRKRSEAVRIKNTFTCITCNKICYSEPAKLNKRKFCSNACRSKIKKEILCCYCNKLFSPTSKKSKFCSGICRNKVNNQNIIGNRSKAEILLENTITQTFPDLTVLYNDRKMLNGLELDVYIPSLNLAIEWNGIFHYKQIKGSLLERYNIKDRQKLKLCKQLGIKLIVVKDLTSHNVFIKLKVKQIATILHKMLAKKK
jgi:hypothetical protein